jgi:hypothetical protein
MSFGKIKTPIQEKQLRDFYIRDKKSAEEIAKLLGCSAHKVNYAMERYQIQKRSISEAIYVKNNPNGDPFHFQKPETLEGAMLFGMGIGLYWGEGTKADLGSVRLGNTDPGLSKTFIRFLVEIYGIQKKDLRFGLQIFTDMRVRETLAFWQKALKIERSQFYKPIITKSRSLGTYRKKSKYGVLTVYYSNKKLRNLLIKQLDEMRPE